MGFDYWLNYGLTPLQWSLMALCGLMIGMSKTGIQGIGTLVVPIMAFVFGGKPSTGFLLPMLCMADLFAVGYYRRQAQWGYVLRLLPWTLAGFYIAVRIDRLIPTEEFKHLIGICILLGLAILLWNENRDDSKPLPKGIWFVAIFGIMGGFTTMIGNAAGPILAVYLLSMRLPKTSFVGTGAWFFMIVNLLKVPIQIYSWNNITWQSFSLNLMILPAIAVGAFIGVYFVKYISEKWFRRFIIAITVITSLFLF